ncbi:MAG: hypothetical protein WA751_03095 [Candidatus Dormiibacterota bacterium]
MAPPVAPALLVPDMFGQVLEFAPLPGVVVAGDVAGVVVAAT